MDGRTNGRTNGRADRAETRARGGVEKYLLDKGPVQSPFFVSHDSPIIVSRGPNCAQFRKPSASLSRVGGGGRRARANGIVESVDARASGPSRGARERERERGTNERSIGRWNRSRSSIIGTVGAIGRAVRGGSSVRGERWSCRRARCVDARCSRGVDCETGRRDEASRMTISGRMGNERRRDGSIARWTR